MDLVFLATEAAAEGGGSAGAQIAVVILLIGLAVFAIAYVVVGPGRNRTGKKRMGDIPLAMRPHHSDEELETTALERAMSWGVALSLFAAVFIAVYWWIEPARINNKVDEFYTKDVAAGHALFETNCATCHGSDAGGGSAPNPYNADAPWPAPNLSNLQARYADSDIVSDVEQFMTMTIKQGRAGTPMPAWGAAYSGPMNDQQVEQIVKYLLSIQTGQVEAVDAQAFVGASGEDLFTNNCARCHGYNLEGQVGPQLLNVFERYGADPTDPASLQAVRDTIRGTVTNGRYVPTGAIMPPFANVLTDDAITSIIDYIESQQVTGGPRFGQIGGDPTTSEGGQ